MKQNYKIKIGNTGLSEEAIDRHKNFESVLQRYNSITYPLNKKPLYKNPKTFLGVVIVILLGILVFRAIEEEKSGLTQSGNDTEVVDPSQIPDATPLLPAFNGSPFTFEINPNKPQTVETPDGIKLMIPAFAFGGENEVGGESLANVNLTVVPVTDPAAIAAMGIPTNFNGPAGPQQHEFIAVLDIRADQNGQPLSLAEGKVIQIEWPEKAEKRDGEELFFYDATQKQWLRTGNIEYENRTVEIEETNLPMSDGMEVIEFDNEEQIGDSTWVSEELKSRKSDMEKQIRTETLLIRKFSVDKLGIWDFAVPYKFSDKKSASVKFMDNDRNPIPLSNVYMLSEGMNTVFSFWSLNKENTFDIEWDGSRRNLLVGVNDAGQLVLVDGKAFEKIESGSDVQEVQMRIHPEEIKTLETLKSVLRFSGAES